MSLCLSFEAPARPRLRSLTSKAKVLVSPERLEEVLSSHLAELGVYFDLIRREDSLSLSLHPGEERIVLHLAEGRFVGKARTNGAGPGFHAFLVELLDFVAHEFHLAWEVEDPSGYWQDRDRSALEMAHVDFLRRIVENILEGGEGEFWTLNFPTRRTVIDAPFAIITPTGPWELEQVEAVVAAKTPEEMSRFFPWWNEIDGRYWFGVAQALRWMEVIWNSYDPPGQLEVRRACLSAFEKSKQLDPTLSLPIPEIRRIEHLVAGRSVRPVEAEGDFIGGYRLYRHRWTIANRWDLELPGDFTEPSPSEGGTWAVIGPDSELFLTPYGSLDPSPVASRKAARNMVRQLAAAAARKGEFLRLIKGRDSVSEEAVLWRNSGGELLLQGAKPGPGTFVLVTFTSTNEDLPETWTTAWESLEAIA